MRPQFSSEFHMERQAELLCAADTWRFAHPGRRSLRHRAGTRLVQLGSRLIGGASASPSD